MWLAAASAVCVEGWDDGREVKMDCLYRKEICTGMNKTNIIVIVFCENDNTSKLYIFIRIAEHFPSNTDNTVVRQPTRVTGKDILIAAPVHDNDHFYS